MSPVVLDLDASVGMLPGERRIDWRDDQESLRFGCSRETLRDLGLRLDGQLPADGGTVFMGSGDFHHLSWPLIERIARRHGGQQPLRVLVFDNHPDNMRFPFGVHCGSWVARVAALPGVAQVHVVGITSRDIAAGHAWENQLAPLRAGKLSYWSIGVDTRWSRWLGLGAAFRDFPSADALMQSLGERLRREAMPTYLSIDKDVFAPEVVQTNWDQGVLLEAHLLDALEALRGQVVASDVTGEISRYRYLSRWKRWLSRIDAQADDLDAGEVAGWQAGQHAFNLRLLPRLAQASTPA